MKIFFRPVYLAIALLLGLLTASCAPRAIVVDPIAPKARMAHEQVRAALAATQRVQTAAATSHLQAATIAGDVDKAAVEIARLKRLPEATADTFDDLETIMADLKSQSFTHEIQARQTSEAAAQATADQAAADATLAELDQAAVATDKATEQLKTAIVSQAGNAALGSAVKHLFVGIAILAVLALGIWGASKFKPSLLP